jgi:hypothetical protein
MKSREKIMIKWSIEFLIEEIKSQERVGYKREKVKGKTATSFEIENTDLNIILLCNEPNKKFSLDKLFEEDKNNILNDEISETMLLEYYVSHFELNFTNRTGVISLCYPKRNLP